MFVDTNVGNDRFAVSLLPAVNGRTWHAESPGSECIARLTDVVSQSMVVGSLLSDRHLYNERLKMERDERARNMQARQEGELIGQVKLLQKLNGKTPGSSEELLALGIEKLVEMEQELQRLLRERT